MKSVTKSYTNMSSSTSQTLDLTEVQLAGLYSIVVNGTGVNGSTTYKFTNSIGYISNYVGNASKYNGPDEYRVYASSTSGGYIDIDMVYKKISAGICTFTGTVTFYYFA